MPTSSQTRSVHPPPMRILGIHPGSSGTTRKHFPSAIVAGLPLAMAGKLTRPAPRFNSREWATLLGRSEREGQPHPGAPANGPDGDGEPVRGGLFPGLAVREGETEERAA